MWVLMRGELAALQRSFSRTGVIKVGGIQMDVLLSPALSSILLRQKHYGGQEGGEGEGQHGRVHLAEARC
jgi:hypothetical protein